MLDSKLSFTKHINEKVNIARKWIGIIKHVSEYLPLKSLDEIFINGTKKLLRRLAAIHICSAGQSHSNQISLDVYFFIFFNL